MYMYMSTYMHMWMYMYIWRSTYMCSMTRTRPLRTSLGIHRTLQCFIA